MDPTLATESLFSGNNPLTDREKEVLRLAVRGQSVKEISRVLSLSQGTVRNYLSSCIAKTNTANRYDAAQYVLQQGWL